MTHNKLFVLRDFRFNVSDAGLSLMLCCDTPYEIVIVKDNCEYGCIASHGCTRAYRLYPWDFGTPLVLPASERRFSHRSPVVKLLATACSNSALLAGGSATEGMGHMSADPVVRLPTELLSRVTATFSPADIASTLTVSSAWKEAFGRTVQCIRPHGRLPAKTQLSKPFPELQELYLDRCEGASFTDEHIKDVARLPDLRHLSLEGFKNCTDEGVAALTCLTGTAALRLPVIILSKELADSYHCAKQVCLDAEVVPEQAACGPLSEGAAWPCAQLSPKPGSHAGLQELRLTSCTRLSHGCLVHLSNASSLTRLDLSQCKWVDNRDMAILRGYRQLQDLSLACCAAVTNSGRRQVPGLTHLHHMCTRGFCLLQSAMVPGKHMAVLCRYCITVTEHWSGEP